MICKEELKRMILKNWRDVEFPEDEKYNFLRDDLRWVDSVEDDVDYEIDDDWDDDENGHLVFTSEDDFEYSDVHIIKIEEYRNELQDIFSKNEDINEIRRKVYDDEEKSRIYTIENEYEQWKLDELLDDLTDNELVELENCLCYEGEDSWILKKQIQLPNGNFDWVPLKICPDNWDLVDIENYINSVADEIDDFVVLVDIKTNRLYKIWNID